MDQIQQQLEELLQSHGVHTERYGYWILAGGETPGFSGSTSSVEETASGIELQLDITVFVNEESAIIESYAGTGSSMEQAVQNALETFACSSLHVILGALCGVVDRQGVTLEKWTIGGVNWDAFISSCGLTPEGETAELPEELFPMIGRLIRERSLQGDLHWVQIFHGRGESGPRVEVRLDNEPWEAAQKQAAALAWTGPDKFLCVQNLLILRRGAGTH